MFASTTPVPGSELMVFPVTFGDVKLLRDARDQAKEKNAVVVEMGEYQIRVHLLALCSDGSADVTSFCYDALRFTTVHTCRNAEIKHIKVRSHSTLF